MTAITDASAGPSVAAGWLDPSDPDRHLRYFAAVTQTVYRNSVGRVVVDVTHYDGSHTTRTELLADVPVHVDAALLIERQGARLIDEALTRAASLA